MEMDHAAPLRLRHCLDRAGQPAIFVHHREVAESYFVKNVIQDGLITDDVEVLGAVLGAFLIGVAEDVSVLVVGSQYRAAVGFFAILIVLSLRPRGLLGERAF